MESWIFFTQCPKKWKRKSYQIFFLKFILWTLKMQFWQQCLKIFAIKSNSLVPCQKVFKKTIFQWQSIFSSKHPFGHVSRSFGNLADLLIQEAFNFSLEDATKNEKTKLYQKDPKNIYNATFDNPIENFSMKNRTYFAQGTKMVEENTHYQRKKNSLEYL